MMTYTVHHLDGIIRIEVIIMFFFDDNYVAIIGDIIDSKKIDDRFIVQENLNMALTIINEKYKDLIASKFAITLGDEFQGLLKKRENIMSIIEDIEMIMYPIRFRFGVGIGKISTDINYDNSSKVDGPAYYYAREMINKFNKMKYKYEGTQSHIMIYTGDKNANFDILINSILSVCTALKYKWTDRQNEIIKMYIESNKNQHQTANNLNINQSVVSKTLKKTDYFTYVAAINNVDNFLTKE